MTWLASWIRRRTGIVERNRRWTSSWTRCTIRDRTGWRGIFLGGLYDFVTMDKEVNETDRLQIVRHTTMMAQARSKWAGGYEKR